MYRALTGSQRLIEPLEALVAGPLECQPAHVALYKIPEFAVRHAEFQPVPTFELECHVVCRGGMVMVISSMVVMRHTGPFCHDPGINRQDRGAVVPVPFRNTPEYKYDDKDQDHDESKTKKYRENVEKHIKH